MFDVDDLTLNEWTELVHEHPGLLRRPLLLSPEQLIVGYNKEEYEGIIKKYNATAGTSLHKAVGC
jgi:regulatory protein spx